MTTYTISKGHQYSANGVQVMWSDWSRIARVTLNALRMDGTVGNAMGGDLLPRAGADEIMAAVAATAADGQERVLTLGAPVVTTALPSTPALCPHCQTYCCGDCTAH